MPGMRRIICPTSQAWGLMRPQWVEGNSRPVFKCFLWDGAFWEPSTVPVKSRPSLVSPTTGGALYCEHIVRGSIDNNVEIIKLLGSVKRLILQWKCFLLFCIWATTLQPLVNLQNVNPCQDWQCFEFFSWVWTKQRQWGATLRESCVYRARSMQSSMRNADKHSGVCLLFALSAKRSKTNWKLRASCFHSRTWSVLFCQRKLCIHSDRLVRWRTLVLFLHKYLMSMVLLSKHGVTEKLPNKTADLFKYLKSVLK